MSELTDPPFDTREPHRSVTPQPVRGVDDPLRSREQAALDLAVAALKAVFRCGNTRCMGCRHKISDALASIDELRGEQP